MKQTVYKCNICGDETEKQFICGIKFTFDNQLELVDPKRTDNFHLCINCYNGIIDYSNKHPEIFLTETGEIY